MDKSLSLDKIIKGVYIRHSEQTGLFVYQYVCSICESPFNESSPELSVPILCEYCYHNCPFPEKVDQTRKMH